jgi:hypothetical protein
MLIGVNSILRSDSTHISSPTEPYQIYNKTDNCKVNMATVSTDSEDVMYQANYIGPTTGKRTVRPVNRQHHSQLLCVSLQFYIAFNLVFCNPHTV